jgi:hypothetical protein
MHQGTVRLRFTCFFGSQDRFRTCNNMPRTYLDGLEIVVYLEIHRNVTITPPDYFFMLSPKDSNLDKQNQSLLSCR